MSKQESLEKKIRKVLEVDTESRNSDIRLTQMVWWTSYRSHLRMIDGKPYIEMKELFTLPREDNIKRVRAKIQNVDKEFLPTDPKVAEKRGWEIDEWREYLGYPTGDTL